MKTIIIHSRKYNCTATFINDVMFIQRLAKLAVKMIIESNRHLNDLPQVRAILLRFVPMWAKTAIENEFVDYFRNHNEIELEGFVIFRLNKQAQSLNTTINTILEKIVSAPKYG